jgi:hypothetical protein
MGKILVKNSFTAASVPAGLSAGELAVNVIDKKLFVGNAVGGVVTLVDPNALVTSVNGLTGAVQGVSTAPGGTYNSIQYNNAGVLDGTPYAYVNGTVLYSPTFETTAITNTDGSSLTIGVADSGNLTMYTEDGNISLQSSGTVSITGTEFTINPVTSINLAGGVLYIDDTNNRVGVNTITPAYPLDIIGVTQFRTGLSAAGGTFSGNISAPNIVNSFNGLTGTVTGVGTAVAGTGISVSGATGAVTITNIGVRTFNGFTGGITFAAGTGITFTASAGTITISSSGSEGITAGGANTFTALQTFSAGISASGATFNGLISGATATFSKDITVNSMTVGRGGGDSNTNVAVGLRTLIVNTSGTENTALGTDALKGNSSGSRNVGIGNAALYYASTRNDNIAIGNASMAYLGLGSLNIGIGTESLGSVFNSGSQNVAAGYQSLKSNSSGANNVGMGYQSLFSDTTGLDNTGIGTNALRQNTTGSNNTAVGSDAGRYRGTATDNNTTGSGGIYIGYQARGSTLAQTNEIVIGVNAIGLGSNTAVIGATLQSAATIYGVLKLPSGLSAAGATFSAPITSTRMARHTSAAISAQKTADFSPTAAEDGTVFYINYSGKGMDVTLEGLPIGWRAKFFNTGSGSVNFVSTTGSVFGIGVASSAEFMVEAICITTNTYFIG